MAGAPIKRHIALIEAVGKRVGDKMDLMLDPACIFKTFGDALKIGRACDDQNFYWLEDPTWTAGFRLSDTASLDR